MLVSEVLKNSNPEIDLFLSHVLGKPKEFLYMHPEYRMSEYQIIRLKKLIIRRQKGEPIAYILGYKDFLGLRFKVNNNVLVPRPETERLVEQVISNLQFPISNGELVRILDVGTGSGAISISLAKKLQISNYKYQITATDVAEKALKVAKENAKAHKVKIKFIKSNLLKNIKQDFDIIVANLPYVPEQDYKKLYMSLKFEPQNAIFEKENGLKLIKELLEQISQKTVKPKLLYLEFDPRQKQELVKLIKRTLSSSKATFYKDYAKLWRFVEITLK